MTRRGLLSRLLLFGAAGGGMLWLRDKVIAPAPAVVFAHGTRSTGWIPLLGEQLVVVPALAAGRPLRALIDTGAQLSAMDAGLAQELRLSSAPVPMVVFGLEGAPRLGRVASVDLGVGPMVAHGLRVADLDLQRLAVPADVAFSMILGQNLLQALAVDLDLPRRRVAFSRASDFTPPAGAVLAATRREHGRLMASIRIAGAAFDVVVDTGATAALALAEDAARKAGLLDHARGRPSISITLGGARAGAEVVLPDFEFSGLQVPSVPVQLFDRTSGGPWGSALLPQGLLGLGALASLRVVLLLGRGELYIVPESVS